MKNAVAEASKQAGAPSFQFREKREEGSTEGNDYCHSPPSLINPSTLELEKPPAERRKVVRELRVPCKSSSCPRPGASTLYTLYFWSTEPQICQQAMQMCWRQAKGPAAVLCTGTILHNPASARGHSFDRDRVLLLSVSGRRKRVVVSLSIRTGRLG